MTTICKKARAIHIKERNRYLEGSISHFNNAVQKRSKAGKANRKELKYNHTSGSRSFVAAMTSKVGRLNRMLKV